MTPLVMALTGVMFYLGAASTDGGTDLRSGRYTDLASLVRSESRAARLLTAQAEELRAEIAKTTDEIDDAQVAKRRIEVEALSAPAGLTPVSGPAVTVTLSDAPEEVINATDPNDIYKVIVHQQDIQAVVKAMWKGGARAITVQGKRLITTTGIKCEGSAVLLGGSPYPQPYVITAIGDQATILQALEFDATLQKYREDAASPEIDVGWDLSTEAIATAPAYDGLQQLNFATPTDPTEGS